MTEHLIVIRYVSPSGEISATTKAQGGNNKELILVIDTGAKNQEVDFSFVKDRAQAILISAEQKTSIRTNNPTKPDETITLEAGQSRVWAAGNPSFRPVFEKDVAKLFVTDESESGKPFSLNIRSISKA